MAKRGRPAGFANMDRINAIIAMRGNGATYEEIGSFFGVSRQRIEQVLKKYAPEETGYRLKVCERCKKPLHRIKPVFGRDVCQVCLWEQRLVDFEEKDAGFVSKVEKMRKAGVVWREITEKFFPNAPFYNYSHRAYMSRFDKLERIKRNIDFWRSRDV